MLVILIIADAEKYHKGMIVYHEVSSDMLETVRHDGLKCTSRGEKGDDPAIINTDKFLDEHCPDDLQTIGLSRNNNLYGYVSAGSEVIDIRNGKLININQLLNQNDQVLLKLDVDPARCYVSDIDKYDYVKLAMENNEPPAKLELLAQDYWRSIKSFESCDMADFKRPEVMITYDIGPGSIQIVGR